MFRVGGSARECPGSTGRLLSQRRGKLFGQPVENLEQYRSTVLTAFQNVAGTLSALERDADALKADAAKVALELSRRQLETGYASNLVLINAEQAYQQAVVNLAQAQANRYADTVALFQALGGGWWNCADFSKN